MQRDGIFCYGYVIEAQSCRSSDAAHQHKSVQNLRVKGLATRGGPLESKSSMLAFLQREDVSRVLLSHICPVHRTVSQGA